jgi:hypothetical protein
MCDSGSGFGFLLRSYINDFNLVQFLEADGTRMALYEYLWINQFVRCCCRNRGQVNADQGQTFVILVWFTATQLLF